MMPSIRSRARARTGAAAAWMLAVALSGCAVGPDYVAPSAGLAPFHNLGAVSARRAALPAPPLDQWWTGFHDPMLVTLVQRALAQNLDVAAAFARVQQARAAASGAGAELLPSVDFGTSATAAHQSVEGPLGSLARNFPGYTRGQREYTLGPSASWEIDLFGGLRRGAQAATDEMQAAQAERAGTRITVAADAADAYLQIRGYQARLAVARQQVGTDAHLLGLVRARYQAGQADGREVAQAEALLRGAQASIPPLRAGLESQLNRLDVLMGAQPGTYAADLAQPGEIPAVPAIGADNQPLDVLRRRPDVRAAERRLAASSERIGEAISDYYPKISLSGALGFDSLNVGHFLTSNAFQATGAGALRWRLFDFGKIDAEVAQAHGANAEALAQYRLAVLKAAEDVEDALSLLSETEVHVVELQGQVDALVRARDLSQRAYEAGAIPLTDVLDANRELLVARDQLDAGRADAARAAVSTFRALGGGWDVSPPGANEVAAAGG
ncbi:NodT family efflux transporter outer membrane factor (OMF) lipoprotein [Paraburkholderia caballeronis]|uniref:efflux transporter outer membrane subunit n=1 Tax=Paraburkholderia caballeronis TaxID=416943 RepID=UPI0010CFE4A7|nr:NodT family efflux transporter outer membrane factor (OMF) lipoprotein [Paraburkholderia caballeronis]